MEEVKILVFAIVSFLSQENMPIAAKSAEIDINAKTKQITLHQYDIYSLEEYKDDAKVNLDTLMRANSVLADLAPIRMTSKHMYVDKGKLNATLYLQYNDIKDLRKISFYADEEGNLSYPYFDTYNYVLETGKVDKRYIKFNADSIVRFSMERKENTFEGVYSLSDDFKTLEANRYVDVSSKFSKTDFEKVRQFIFKKGNRQTYRSFDNDNPHYKFKDFDVYLGTGKQNYFTADKLKNKDYIELVIHDRDYFTLYLSAEKTLGKTKEHLESGKVYWHNRAYKKEKSLDSYMVKMLEEVKK